METKNSRLQSQTHFQWIDFLRGIAALEIVLFHVRVDLWVGWEAIHHAPGHFSKFDHLAALLSLPTPFFGSAVMLFFLVSGFCVHYPYAEGRALELKPYSLRRWPRIYPPYLLAVLLAALIEGFLKFRFGAATSPLKTTALSMTKLQNFGAGQMVSNPSLWSLPVEAELYLAYPLFYWLARRQGWKAALTIVFFVSLTALGLSFRFQGAIAGHFAVYWIIWCAGVLLAQAAARKKLPVWNGELGTLTATALAALIAGYLLKWPSLVQNFVSAWFYFMVMLWGMTRPEPLRWLPERIRKGLLFIGTISYSLYLIHFPLFRLCSTVWVAQFGAKPDNFFVPLFFTLLSLPVAALFHAIIEAPSHRLARKIGRQISAQQRAVETPDSAGNATTPKDIVGIINDRTTL